ncbi:hypothetical protein ACOMHN_004745 [Nucella lapillus]
MFTFLDNACLGNPSPVSEDGNQNGGEHSPPTFPSDSSTSCCRTSSDPEEEECGSSSPGGSMYAEAATIPVTNSHVVEQEHPMQDAFETDAVKPSEQEDDSPYTDEDLPRAGSQNQQDSQEEPQNNHEAPTRKEASKKAFESKDDSRELPGTTLYSKKDAFGDLLLEKNTAGVPPALKAADRQKTVHEFPPAATARMATVWPPAAMTYKLLPALSLTKRDAETAGQIGSVDNFWWVALVYITVLILAVFIGICVCCILQRYRQRSVLVPSDDIAVQMREAWL